MKRDPKTLMLSGGLLVLVALGVVWIARDLRRGTSPMVLKEPTPSGGPARLHPDLTAGLEALRAEDLHTARDRLLRVPNTDPGYALALDNLGQVYEKMGDMAAAAKSYSEIISLQPENPEPYVSLSWVRYHLGDLEAAEIATLRTLEIAPRHVQARYNVALFRAAQGKVAEAIRAYSRALSMDPDRRYRWQAEDQLLTLSASRPDLADAHYALAYLANARGDPGEEIKRLENYLSLDPSGPAAETAKARLAEARGATAPGPQGE